MTKNLPTARRSLPPLGVIAATVGRLGSILFLLTWASGCLTRPTQPSVANQNTPAPIQLPVKQAPSATARFPPIPVSPPSAVVILVEENKDLLDITGVNGDYPNAPYLKSLAERGATFDNMYALHHPSLPNYLELFSGASQGVTRDCCPLERCQPQSNCNDSGACPTNNEPGAPAPFDGPSLGGRLSSMGLSFTGYAEDLPKDPRACCGGFYARKHCPWLEFKDVPAKNSNGSDTTKNFSQFLMDVSGYQLPTVSMVIPNLIHDMHSPIPESYDFSIATQVLNGDNWLRENIEPYIRWAMQHNGLLIITWDESSSGCAPCSTFPPGNHIPTFFVGPMVKPGYRSDYLYSHYNILRTIEELYGITPLGGTAAVAPIGDIWVDH